jgi:ribosomal protein S18 acetylase RimI-like enzyme
MTLQAQPRHFEPARDVAVALPWVHASAQPYIDWLLGGRAAASELLEQWMRRPSSEVFLERAVLLLDGVHPVGGYIALSGRELWECRRADTLPLIAATPRERRSSLFVKMGPAHRLFPEVPPDHFHLSRMGILPGERRRGHGRAIIAEYLRDGAERGFHRFSDVNAGNRAAIELYRSAGFQIADRHQIPETGMSYLRMVLEAIQNSGDPVG